MGEIITTATLVWHSPGPVLVPTFLHHLPLVPTRPPHTQNQDIATQPQCLRARLVLDTDAQIDTCFGAVLLIIQCHLLSTVWLEYWLFYIFVLQHFAELIFMCSLCLSVQASGAIHVLPQASSRHETENSRLLWAPVPRQDFWWGQHPEWTQRPAQRGETAALSRPQSEFKPRTFQ